MSKFYASLEKLEDSQKIGRSLTRLSRGVVCLMVAGPMLAIAVFFFAASGPKDEVPRVLGLLFLVGSFVLGIRGAVHAATGAVIALGLLVRSGGSRHMPM